MQACQLPASAKRIHHVDPQRNVNRLLLGTSHSINNADDLRRHAATYPSSASYACGRHLQPAHREPGKSFQKFARAPRKSANRPLHIRIAQRCAKISVARIFSVKISRLRAHKRPPHRTLSAHPRRRRHDIIPPSRCPSRAQLISTASPVSEMSGTSSAIETLPPSSAFCAWGQTKT